MNNPKEAIKLARRLYDMDKMTSVAAILYDYNLVPGEHINIENALTNLEQEYGILDEVVTESEIDKHFKARCESHEMSDENYLIKKAKEENRDLTEGEVMFLTGGIDLELAGIDTDGDATEELLCSTACEEQSVRFALIGVVLALTALAGVLIGLFLRLII